MRRSCVSVIIAAILITPGAHAQKKDKRYDPPRPRLAVSMDSNFAGSYHMLGMSRLSKDPEMAAAAFHWARRIDPSLAEAFYAERIARHLSDTLAPRGVGVVIEAEHTCMTLRGARSPGARTTTSALFGVMRDDPRSRAEFLDLTRTP